MKKLVFLGDSIRLMGYGYQVAELLSDEYETWQPGDNCRFAAYTLRMCFDVGKCHAGQRGGKCCLCNSRTPNLQKNAHKTCEATKKYG